MQPAQETAPESSKSYQVLMNYINSTPYREELTQWYNLVGKGRVSLGQLKLKIEDIKKNVNSDADVNESIHNALINNYMAFYPAKKKYENKNTIVNSSTVHTTIVQNQTPAVDYSHVW